MKILFNEMISSIFKTGKEKKPILFVVNTDENYGLYVKKLVRLTNKLGLVVKSKAALKHIVSGDILVFGDSHLFKDDFDYRVLRNPELLDTAIYEAESVEAFDLVKEFDEVLEAIQNLYPQKVVQNKKGNTAFVTLGDVFGQRTRTCRPEPQHTIVLLNYEEYDDEDVTIHDTFVKIGYNQYDIWVEDGTGREFIEVNGNRRYILVDRFGQKYLK